MELRKQPIDIWNEYQRGVSFNTSIDLYNTVEDNENFYLGKQWEGVKAPDIQKPTLNVIKRIVAYFVAEITSDDIGIRLKPFDEGGNMDDLMSALGKDIERIMEDDQTKAKFRDILRNTCVDGDGCLYWYWDSNVKTGTEAMGDVRSEVVENINVMFGNPFEQSVQKQPYIIIVLRKPLCEVREEAKANGISDYDEIVPDMDYRQGEVSEGNDLVTVLVKLWKEGGTLHAVKTTHDILVKKEWDTGCTLYPVAWMVWDNVRHNYHGRSPVTGMIPNQIYINKLMAMYARSVELNAFPKVVYDRTKFGRTGWTNRIGEAIGVDGDVSQAAVNVLRGGEVSNQVMEVISAMMQYTKECMGANDSALGSVNVEQATASGIIANQQASAAPLELQHREFFDFVEQCVRIILDMMRAYYGERNAKFEIKQEAQTDPATGISLPQDPITYNSPVDYSLIADEVRNLDVTIGSSSYWSELAQQQTMDNLLQAGIITDPVLFLEAVPDKLLPNKQKLIDAMKQSQQAQQQQSMAQQQNELSMQQQASAAPTQTDPISAQRQQYLGNVESAMM